jgi:Glycoside hydrolase family 44
MARLPTAPLAIVPLLLVIAACDAGQSSKPATSSQGSGGASTGSTTSTSASTSTTGTGGAAPLAGTVVLTRVGAAAISPAAFGQNYWSWEPSFGDPLAGTETLAKAMHLGFLRAGGDNNDTQMPSAFTEAEVDAFVAYSKAVGAEPDLQVPILADVTGQPATAQTAADMVTYANKTMGYGIKYWSIGNEPDLYSTATGFPAFASYTAAEYCATFTAYAKAMKAVDPTIKILGPELSYKYIPGDDWLTPFLDGCKDQVDIVTVHRYPLDPSATTVAAAFADADAMRALAAALRANLDQHGMTATPLAFTEANVTWDGTPAKSTLPASPSTFFAGLWAADVTGVGLEAGLFTQAFWHVADGATGWKLAFILGGQPAPAYHAVSLFAQHFGGDILRVSGVPTGFSVFGSQDDQAGTTAVIVLNKTAVAARLTLTFDQLAPRDLTLEGESQAAVVIPTGGGAAQVLRYTQALAAAGMGPAQDP